MTETSNEAYIEASTITSNTGSTVKSTVPSTGASTGASTGSSFYIYHGASNIYIFFITFHIYHGASSLVDINYCFMISEYSIYEKIHQNYKEIGAKPGLICSDLDLVG